MLADILLITTTREAHRLFFPLKNLLKPTTIPLKNEEGRGQKKKMDYLKKTLGFSDASILLTVIIISI